MSEVVLVWVLIFETPYYRMKAGEYADRESCVRAGKLLTKRALTRAKPEGAGKWPPNFGCWPERNVMLE